MQVVSPDLVKGKKVLLRLDIDVPLRLTSLAQGHGRLEVADDFRLRAGLPTLKLCLEHADQIIVMGHIGRPGGREVPDLSVAPIHDWLVSHGLHSHMESGKLKLLENLRFEKGEESCSPEYAKELAAMGNFFVNEAFASYHPSASTTILPTLLPHAGGLRFANEVMKLTEVRDNPKKPFIAIMGGVKMEDKLPVINVLAERANAVLVGGKLAKIIHEESFNFPHNVLAGMLTEDGFDIAPHTIEAWEPLIKGAKMIVWNGPVGRISDIGNQKSDFGSAKGTYEIAKLLLNCDAELVIGGGDTVGFLGKIGLLGNFQEKGFVSTGGGAMLKFLADGTLPSIEALK